MPLLNWICYLVVQKQNGGKKIGEKNLNFSSRFYYWFTPLCQSHHLAF